MERGQEAPLALLNELLAQKERLRGCERRLEPDYWCAPPRYYTIEPCSYCNLRCPFCPTGTRRGGGHKGMLTTANAATILIKLLPYATNVNFYNWGEPFLNKHLPEIIRMYSMVGITTRVSSNLSHIDFDREYAERIVLSGLHELLVSVDGASQETYGRYRVGGNLDRVLSNMLLISQAKVRLSSLSPVVTWQFLVNRFNEHEMDRAKELAAMIGVEIIFPLMSCWDKSWESSLHRRGEAGDETRREAQYSLGRLPMACDELRLHPALPGECGNTFNNMIIDYDGSVRPCCNSWGDGTIVGNLLHQELEQVWNGKQLRDCRQFLHCYGPVQDNTSVCATQSCPLSAKSLHS